MRVAPKTAQEIAEAGLWPAGIYDFEIIEAEDTTSKTSGNDMIKLKVKIFNESGQSQNLFDYLLDAVAYKLRHAAEAFGLLDEYEAGGFDAIDCIGKTGQCKVKIDKDKSGAYPDKNGIADYIVTPSVVGMVKAEKKARVAGGGDLDDSIPFAPCWQ